MGWFLFYENWSLNPLYKKQRESAFWKVAIRKINGKKAFIFRNTLALKSTTEQVIVNNLLRQE